MNEDLIFEPVIETGDIECDSCGKWLSYDDDLIYAIPPNNERYCRECAIEWLDDNLLI